MKLKIGFLFLISVLCNSLLLSQIIPCEGDCATADPPLVADGSYKVQQVIEAEGKTAEQIYGATKAWFSSSYTSAQDVIQSDDPYNYILVGRAWSGIDVKVMGIAAEPKLWYTLKIEAKDGRARYTIYNMEYDGSSSMGTYRKPLSQAFFETRHRNGKKLNSRDEQIRRGWIENVNAVAASLEQAISEKPAELDDW